LEKIMKKQLLSLAAASALLLAASNSFADPLPMSVTIVGGCAMTVTPVASLGTYTNGGSTESGIPAGDVGVTCPNGVNYRIMFDNGANGTATTRSMIDNTTSAIFIGYVLKSAATTLEVGDGNPMDATPITMAGINGISDVGSTALQPHALTADITIAAAQVADTYTDTVTVTLTL
jgi:spore coat protein U-like protein